MSPTTIFVYGTLKRGGYYHHYLADQEFVAVAGTSAGYTLHQPADYPAMVQDAGDTTGVTGELWTVSAECLQKLDQLEGVNEQLYIRVPVPLNPPHSALKAESYINLRPITGHPHLGSTWQQPPAATSLSGLSTTPVSH